MLNASAFSPFLVGADRPPLWLAGLALVMLISSCSSPRRPPTADDPAIRRYAERAYQPEHRYVAETLNESWPSNDPAAPADIAVTLTLPREAGRYPLIVYLPGLGEAADAGRAWRTAWVEAGYAVLSLQPTRFGPSVWQGRYAKNADFTALARENYATAALNERLGAVRRVLFELEKRVDRSMLPFDRIDLGRTVLAGYELGAQTVQALAGERQTGVDRSPLHHPPTAAILLSPYANAAAGGFAQRFGAINLPVFAATATEDSDRFGVVTALAARLAPYAHMPDGDKYLLLISGGSHRLLSGAPLSAGDEGEAAATGRDGPGGDGGRPSGGGPGGGGGMPPGGGRGGSGGGLGGGPGGPGGRPGAGGLSAYPVASSARQVIAIQRLSVAFLDAQLKKDPIAVEWLARDAGRWLEPVGELRRK